MLRLAVAGLVVLSACSQAGSAESDSSASRTAAAGVKTTPSPSPSMEPEVALPASLGDPGRPGCDPPSPMAPHPPPQDWLIEAQGSSETEELWALLFAPLEVGQPIKIVWRMTGEGEFSVVATHHEKGVQVEDPEGPSAHLGSDWKRPGREWGTFFTFPDEGCWEFTARRGDSVGYLWAVVSP